MYRGADAKPCESMMLRTLVMSCRLTNKLSHERSKTLDYQMTGIRHKICRHVIKCAGGSRSWEVGTVICKRLRQINKDQLMNIDQANSIQANDFRADSLYGTPLLPSPPVFSTLETRWGGC